MHNKELERQAINELFELNDSTNYYDNILNDRLIKIDKWINHNPNNIFSKKNSNTYHSPHNKIVKNKKQTIHNNNNINFTNNYSKNKKQNNKNIISTNYKHQSTISISNYFIQKEKEEDYSNSYKIKNSYLYLLNDKSKILEKENKKKKKFHNFKSEKNKFSSLHTENYIKTEDDETKNKKKHKKSKSYLLKMIDFVKKLKEKQIKTNEIKLKNEKENKNLDLFLPIIGKTQNSIIPNELLENFDSGLVMKSNPLTGYLKKIKEENEKKKLKSNKFLKNDLFYKTEIRFNENCEDYCFRKKKINSLTNNFKQ